MRQLERGSAVVLDLAKLLKACGLVALVALACDGVLYARDTY
jgi:hypothetical protein